MNWNSSEEHREYLVKEIANYIDNKYKKGQEAHGGKLWRKNMTPHAVEEAADLCVYLFTKREQERLLSRKINILIAYIEGMQTYAHDKEKAISLVQEIKNIITIGNPEGIEEEEHEGE